MAYEILQTCMLVPGVSENNCSGWVQAWGSIIGLAVAIAVPYWLHRKDFAARTEAEIATALVVATSAHPLIKNCIFALGIAQYQYEQKKAGKPFIATVAFSQAINAPLPSEETMLALIPLRRGVAKTLAEAVTVMGHIRSMGETAINPGNVLAKDFAINAVQSEVDRAHALLLSASSAIDQAFQAHRAT